MKNKQSYQLIHGVLEIDNAEIKIKYSTLKYGLEVFKFFASAAFIASFIEKVQNFENLTGTYELIKFGIFGIASLYLVYLFIKSLFKKVWLPTIAINEIIKIEVDKNEDEKDVDEDSKIKVTLIKNNGRQKGIKLQKNKNEIDDFLSNLKKKNTRLEIVCIENE